MRFISGLIALFGLLASASVSADSFAYIASGTNSSEAYPEISVINTHTGKLVTAVSLPEKAGAAAVLPNSTGSRVYVVASSQGGSTYIHNLDANLNKVVNTTTFALYNANDINSGIRVDTAVLSPDDRWLVMAVNPSLTGGNYPLWLVDLKNGSARYPIYTLGDGTTAQSIAVSPDGKYVAIVRSSYWEGLAVPDINSKGNYASVVTLLDLERVGKVIDEAIARNQADPTDLTVEYMRANGIAGDAVYFIPAPSNPNLENASAGVIFSPDPVDPDNNPLRLYVANSWADTISVFTIGNNGDSAAWLTALNTPTPLDPRLASIYQMYPSTVELIQSAAPVAVPTTLCGSGSAPYGLALSPDNKTLYMTLSRRWSTEWNSSTTSQDGCLAYMDVETTLSPGVPAKIPLYLWAPPFTTFHPRAISVVPDPDLPGEVTIAFIKQIAGSSTAEGTLDGYYLSTIRVVSDELRGTKTFTELENVQVSDANRTPLYLNADFVGEDCQSCPLGPEDSIRKRLNPPTAVSPAWLLLLVTMLMISRRFYSRRR